MRIRPRHASDLGRCLDLRATELGRLPVQDVVRSHAAAVARYERAGWWPAGEVRVTFANGQEVDELVSVGTGELAGGEAGAVAAAGAGCGFAEPAR